MKSVEDVEDVYPCKDNHYTGDMLAILKNYSYSFYKNDNKNKNGKRFEKIVQIYLQKRYGFEIFDSRYGKEDYAERDMFAKKMPLRILRKNVPLSTMEDFLY